MRKFDLVREDMVKSRVKSFLYLTAITVAIATIGSAATLANGSVGFNFTGLSVDTPNSLTAHTKFTIPIVATNNNGTASFGCPGPDCVALATSASITSPFFGDALNGLVLAFGQAGRFTYTVTSQFAPTITQNGLNYADSTFTLGTFHDSTGTFADAAASLVFAFSQSCSGTAPCSPSGSATFATPPATLPTPEPTGLFLTGCSLLGLGLVRRKRVS